MRRGAGLLFAAMGFAGCDAAPVMHPPPSLLPPVRETSLPSGFPYDATHDWDSDAMGHFETGMALTDIDGDGRVDLVTSSGNDGALQPVAVYLQTDRGFPKRPTWRSGDYDGNMGLCVGDVDRDGDNDVAVTTLGDYGGAGGVKVYTNDAGTLESTPSYRTGERYSAFACAFGDADADGWLDLGVSVMGGAEEQLAGKPRIYRNHLGHLDAQPSWKGDAAVFGGGALFADVDDDGYLDFVHGSLQIRLHRGGLVGSPPSVGVASAPSWTSRPGGVAFYLSAGTVGAERRRAVAASRAFWETPADSFELYLPSLGSVEPAWVSGRPGSGGGVRLVDVDGDSLTDLIGGYMGEATLNGGPLEIYLGTPELLSPTPALRTRAPSLGFMQSVDVADIAGSCSVSVTTRIGIAATRRVVTLPHNVIGPIQSVERDGTALARGEFVSVPGQPWISFGKALAPGEVVIATYLVPRRVHVAVANQDCGGGVQIHNFNPSTPDCSK